MAEALMEETGLAPPPLIKEKQTRAMRQMREEEDQELKAWLDSFSGVPDFKISLHRESPERYQDTPTKGLCATYTTPISEEQVKDEWGGGTFVIRVHKSGAHGSIATSRKFTIAGNPKLKEMTNAPPASGPAALADRAMAVLERTNAEANERARQAEQGALRQPQSAPGFDTAMLKAINEPLLRQLDMMAADKRDLENRLSALMQKLADISNRPREESLGDRLVLSMSEKESARIEAIRTQHESEIRAMREVQKMEIERIHAMYKEQISANERSHEREVKSLERSREDSITSMKNSYEMRIEALKETSHSKERELVKSEARVAALETVKIKTPLEQLQDAAAFKDTLEDLGFGGAEKEEGGGTVERIIGGIMNSKIAEGLAGRLANPVIGAAAPAVMGAVAGAQPQSAPDQAAMMAAIEQMPFNKPFRMPDGREIIKLKTPEGTPYLAPYVRKKATPEQVDARKRAKAVSVAPEDVAMAMNFIERAIENGTEPEMFAQSAITMIPKSILVLLRQRGVDFFLHEVAKPGESSPLLTQAGRSWVRKVGKILIGATDEPDVAAEAVPAEAEVEVADGE